MAYETSCSNTITLLKEENNKATFTGKVHWSTKLSLYGSTALCWTLAAFLGSSSFTQAVRLLGRGISPSQGRYLHAGKHKHRMNAHGHPTLKWWRYTVETEAGY
jgi:hypothetical protein